MGKPYKKLAIKTVEHGDKWLSGFQNKDNENWKEGDQVDIVVKENGQYLNFETPKMEDRLESRISALEVQMMNITNKLAKMQPGAVLEQPRGVALGEPTKQQLNEVFPPESEPDF
jgi:hypothetical protein